MQRNRCRPDRGLERGVFSWAVWFRSGILEIMKIFWITILFLPLWAAGIRAGESLLCIISWDQHAWIDESGGICQSQEINLEIRCLNRDQPVP